MLNQDFLQLLACPETKQPLHLADEGTVQRLNDAIKRGAVVNRGQKKVEQPVEALLVREDRQVAYPVWDEIPCLLIDEGISLNEYLASPGDG